MEPQRLQSRQGWEWIKQGFALFKKAPLLWIVLLMICLAAAVGLSNVPVLGEPLLSLLMPVILIGLMTGCRSLKHNEELELAHLFSGFQRQTTQLITLGGIALVGQYLIFGLMKMVGGAELVDILMSNQPDADPELLMQAVTGAGFAVLLGMVLFSVLMMAMQFAPMLVFFNNIAPQQAMKLSLRAFLNNIGPMMVYVTTFMFLAILASIPMMLGWLVLLPLVFTSLYACYCDIFPAVKENRQDAKGGDAFTPDKGVF
ncbi:MAG: BPSS1780 family membrane protein [Gallionella sp.]|nr:BPSS1780 family membrane protein [Gallionella sp.]